MYQLVWSDEFDYEGPPDPSKWRLETGGHGFGNGENQYYTNRLENAIVEEGHLKIRAFQEVFENQKYTSAKLSTYGLQSFQYGKIVINAKIPRGKGTWPALWLLPHSIKEGAPWPGCGEIDLMEHVGRDEDVIHVSLHTGLYNHNKRTQYTYFEKIVDISNRFADYAMEWTEAHMEFSIDGKVFARFEKGQDDKSIEHEGWPFDEPYFLIINLAIGGFWGGEIDTKCLPSLFEINYVRYYQKV